jgi:NAD(P)-dependent dehydrogenase (short-subunit alcohol dehydrogenase family)
MKQAALVIGTSGGIGQALADALDEEARFDRVWRASRREGIDLQIDLTDEASIAAAAATVAQGPQLGLVIVATGILHDAHHRPERSFRELDAAWMAHNYLINTIGPALVAKHFLPLLPKDERSTFAVLSARVGGITDNVLGGWHSYRASKAALNMLIKTFSIELARTHKRAICVALHPGTVATALSEPFQGNVPSAKLFTAERAALQLLDVLDELKPVDSGKHFAWDGDEIAP